MSKLRRVAVLTHPRYWTEADADYLNDHWGLFSDAAIARHLGRSVVAVALKAKKLGINRKMNLFTAREVGRTFGVDAKTVLSWRRRGWLSAQRAGFRQGPHRVWAFDVDELERFVRALPWAFDIGLMAEGDYLTLLAARLAKEDPWLSAVDAAAEVGVVVGTLYRWCLHDGLPCQRRPKLGTQNGPWSGLIFVRKADLLPWLAAHRAREHANRAAAARGRMLRRLGRAA